MRVAAIFFLVQSVVMGQDFNLFDWVKPLPTIKESLTVQPLSVEQMLDLHDAMHEGDNVDRPGHWSYPGDIAVHLQNHPDKRPKQMATTEETTDVEPLRKGKYAFIIIEANEEEFYAWANRSEIEEKGWSIVKQPRRSRLASIVVIGKRIFPVRGYVTNQILRDCVSKTITVPKAPKASGLKITMISRSNCSWCDKWMREEYPKAIAAVGRENVEFKTSDSGPVPRFEVCGSDGQCRLYTGFTSFEKMER